MKTYTVHVKQGARPVLVREGFSLGALVFGPLWLLAHRAWLAALLWLLIWVVLMACTPAPLRGPVWLGLVVLQGLCGRNMQRWGLERRRYALSHVVAGRDEYAAWARLFAARPDLVGRAAL